MGADGELRILFVCTANVCRSPVAAAFLANHLAAENHAIRVSSASVHEQIRSRHPTTMSIIGEKGWQVSAESTPLSAPLTDWADLILTMTAQHALAVAGKYRQARSKVFMLHHFVQIAPARSSGETLNEWLQTVWTLRRSYPTQVGANDIADPIGRGDVFFRRVADELDELTHQVATCIKAPSGEC